MSSQIQTQSAHMTLTKRRLFEALKDQIYRSAFVQERVRSSIALQIRALREQRNKMTQRQLGDALGMAQTWVSKLENPEYGKMTVATLLRLAEAFDSDLEIKFRPFSASIDTLPTQTEEYFRVPSFDEEKAPIEDALRKEEASTSRAVTAPQNWLKFLANYKPGDAPGFFSARDTAVRKMLMYSQATEIMAGHSTANVVSIEAGKGFDMETTVPRKLPQSQTFTETSILSNLQRTGMTQVGSIGIRAPRESLHA